MIKNVRCPLFIAQALEDDTVKWKSADYIYKNAASEFKLIKYYKGSGHLICRSSANQ